MSVREDPQANLAQLEAMLEALDRYLASTSVFRQVVVALPGSGQHTITMSIGVMLDLASALEEASPGLPPDERDASLDAVRRFDAARTEHARAYGDKLLHELKSHLDSWRWFIGECSERPRRCDRDYPDEVRVRLRIDQLLAEASARGIDATAAAKRLVPLDETLRDILRPGPYVGPWGAQDRYPRDTYWWLYGRPDG